MIPEGTVVFHAYDLPGEDFKRTVQTVKLKRKLKHSLYKTLNRRGCRSILAVIGSIITSIRVGKLCKVSYDGEWVQRFPSCTLIEPRLTLWTPGRIDEHNSNLWLHKYLPKGGDTIIDVGAGTGWETLSFSRSVGASGRVISVEAHPKTFHCLSRMCQKNRLTNVTLIQAAVLDQEREVVLTDSEEHEANSLTSSNSGIRVMGTTLDKIFRSEGLSRVDFLKMNIEGAEKLALDGMREMIKKTKNVCISCHDFLAEEGGAEELRTREDVVSFLERYGFVISFLDPDQMWKRDFVYGVNEKLIS